MAKNFYITTPIYYANDRPHIGHAYTTILADVLNRYHRLIGYNTFFLTGTDEHGQKMQQAALKRGSEPQKQADEYHLRFKELWKHLTIDYDRFIRTTEKEHCSYVGRALQQLYDDGLIYAGSYAGWYSVGEERFFDKEELIDGKDPVSGRPVEWIEEKNYFFRMSSYQEALLDHIKRHPDFIQPDFRRREVVAFLQKPLRDLCISRPLQRLSWGIPLPFDENFVTYVWFDALLNYESAVAGITFPDGSSVGPADYHLIGKDILITHAVYWPTMLMALGHPLPRHILTHGWWLSGGRKLSKTSGNSGNPLDHKERHGADSLRYFLVREMALGQDASFTEKLFRERINKDLANDLGNSVSRINKMVQSNFQGYLPKPYKLTSLEQELARQATRSIEKVLSLIPQLQITGILDEIFYLIRSLNRYLENCAPWKLGSSQEELERLASILYTAAESLRLCLTALSPVMPQKMAQGLAMLGCPQKAGAPMLAWGYLKGGEKLAQASPLFPRL